MFNAFNEEKLTIDQIQTLRTLLTIVNSISFLGGLFVVLSLLLRRQLPKFPRSMFFYMVYCELLLSCTFFINIIGEAVNPNIIITNNTLCITQAVLLQISEVSATSWWFIITVNFYLMIVKEMDTNHLRNWYHAICWTATILLTIIPLLSNKMGVISPLWCWIKDYQDDNITKKVAWPIFVYFYGEVGILLAIGCILWILIFRKMRMASQALPENVRKFKATTRIRYMLFITSFLLIFMFLFLHRVFEDIFEVFVYWPWCLYVIVVGCPGVFTFFIFGCRTKNFQLWRKFLCCNMNEYEPINDAF